MTDWRSSARELIGGLGGMLLLCTGGVLILLYFGIFATARQYARETEAMEQARARLQLHQALVPLQAQLEQRAALLGSGSQELAALDLAASPASGPMAERLAALQSAAGQTGNLTEYQLLRRSDGDAMRVTTRSSGDFADIPRYLLGLAGMPDLEGVESISVRVVGGQREIEVVFRLKLP